MWPFNKIVEMYERYKEKQFQEYLLVVVNRIIELDKRHGNAVVCTYCGKLLIKEEAEAVYDAENDTLEFSHKECFAKFNRCDDLVPVDVLEEEEDE